MAEDGYLLDKSAVQRTAKAVKSYYASGGSYGNVGAATRLGGAQVIEAKLTARDGTDTTLYAWTQARRSAAGAWEVLTANGLSGTVANFPAVDPTESGGDLTDRYVLLVRGVIKNAAGQIVPCWYAVVASPLPVGEFYGMVYGNVSQNEGGFFYTPIVSVPPGL